MNFITERLMTKWYNVAWYYSLNRRKYLPDEKLFDMEKRKCIFPVESILPSVSIWFREIVEILDLYCHSIANYILLSTEYR